MFVFWEGHWAGEGNISQFLFDRELLGKKATDLHMANIYFLNGAEINMLFDFFLS